MYDNIIFDLYGTLIDIHTDEEDIAVWKHMCEFYAEHGVKYNPAGLRSKYKRQVRRAEQAMAKKKFKFPEIQILDVFEQLTRKKDQDADDCAELTVKAAQEFRKTSTEYIKLYDGVKEMLGRLKNSGKKLYVLSNAQRVYTLPEIQKLGIEEYFTVYDAAHTETGKGDEIEFSISLDKLADYLGIKLDQGATITVSNPNIGAEGVTITGTPTGPWAGAAIALLMAIGGVIVYRRKRI